MRILIAEDDPVSRRLLKAKLVKWGYEVVVTCDGSQAWEVLQQEDAPRLAVLDWMMPGMDGPEVCKRARALVATRSTYIILLTAKAQKAEVIMGLEAGADDYVTKPFDSAELAARVGVGLRITELQASLSDHVKKLEAALAQINHLQGILPICSYCKRVRDDQNYWQQVEQYISAHTEAQFSHGICPDCYDRVVRRDLEQSRERNN
jgi:sigma-B regulation protein RsbU (phosphoserine phosphatase)